MSIDKLNYIIPGEHKPSKKRIHYLIYTDNKDDLEIYPVVRAACNTFKQALEYILKPESSLSSITIKENYKYHYKYNNNKYKYANYNFRFLHLLTFKTPI